MLRSTTAPSEPSSRLASAVLWTTMELNSSEAKTLKSNARSRLAEAPSVEVAMVSMPFTRTRVNWLESPRTVIERPSPASRLIEMPGMRWSDSARFWSGILAMSSATMASTAATDSRFTLSAFSRLWRKPVTTMSLAWASVAASAAGAAWANAAAGVTSALPAMRASLNSELCVKFGCISIPPRSPAGEFLIPVSKEIKRVACAAFAPLSSQAAVSASLSRNRSCHSK